MTDKIFTDAWNKTLTLLKSDLSKTTYAKRFKQTEFSSHSDQLIIIKSGPADVDEPAGTHSPFAFLICGCSKKDIV